MSVKNVLSTLATGVAVGAALGVLLAPDKGSLTRRRIVKAGNGYANGLDQKFDEFIGNIKEQFKSVKEEAARMISEAQTHFEAAESDLTKAVHRKSRTHA